MDRAVARGGARRVSGKGERLSAADGGSRPLRPALSGVRHGGAAHPLCRQRNQLLSTLPDRRASAGGPLAVTVAQERLATHDRGVGKVTGLDCSAVSLSPVACSVASDSRFALPVRARALSTRVASCPS